MAVDYWLAGIEHSESNTLAVPVGLLTQARLAARKHISLDTVLRWYVAGYTLLNGFIHGEAQRRSDINGDFVEALIHSQGSWFDRLLAEVSDEYAREARAHSLSPDARMAERVQRLLSGELLDTSGFDYDFKSHHIGTVARGPDASAATHALAKELGSRLMVIQIDEETLWGWLDVRRLTDWEKFTRTIVTVWPEHVPLSLGEPGEGLAGWRLTHQQANAAFQVAVSGSSGIIQYADVALLASMIQDELLATSLHEIYLAPLDCGRRGGTVLKETLRAYFAADRNGASTAAALGVSRQTITNRLQTIERRIGRPLRACAGELEAALRLEEVGLIS